MIIMKANDFVQDQASAELGFDAGVLSCLEYLEAAPWAEEEEEKVAAVLAQLDLDCPGTADVLNRVSIRRPEADQIGGEGERTLTELLHVVLEGKDDKARRQMKGLFLRMLRHTAALKPAPLLSASDLCLRRLHSLLLADAGGAAEVGREADNLHWVLEMLVDGQAGEEFLRRWAGAAELAAAHARAPAARRHGVSRVTARLFVGVGRGEILVSSAGRCELVRTWLGPFYEDYSWLRRGCGGGLERREVEEGLGRLVLTLPMGWQQEVLLGWFDRFLDAGEDCPNLQRAFEVWWRRAFWRRRSEEPPAVGGTAAGQVRVLAASQGS